MKLNVYKGFDLNFFKLLNESPLVASDIGKKSRYLILIGRRVSSWKLPSLRWKMMMKLGLHTKNILS